MKFFEQGIYGGCVTVFGDVDELAFPAFESDPWVGVAPCQQLAAVDPFGRQGAAEGVLIECEGLEPADLLDECLEG